MDVHQKRIPEPEILDNVQDEQAIKESQAYANERDLERESKYRESLKSSLFVLIRIFVYIGAIVFLLAGLVLTWHMLTPEQFQWLSQKQLADLQKNFASAALAILVSESAKRYL